MEYTFDEMVSVVKLWYEKEPSEAQQEFKNTPKEKLIVYHTTLGRSIRNEFKLWETEWRPELKDGVDYSPKHPDKISMNIIETVWDQIQ